MEKLIKEKNFNDLSANELLILKEWGFSDRELAKLFKVSEEEIRKRRKELGIVPSVKVVDTCAGEFKAYTPYYYLSHERPFFVLTESGDLKEVRDEG